MTVRVDLAIPDAAVLAIGKLGDLAIMPSEAFNGGFDPTVEWRGSGPFLLTKYSPSVGLTFERNPDHWDQPRPYVDGMTYGSSRSS